MLRLVLLVLLITPRLFAQPAMEPGPKSPEESGRCITVRPGLAVELMAAEPLVMDPIAFAWGPDGKFWVVEMGDYPLGVDGKNKPGGRVKMLTKSKDEGPYDKASLFLDNLGYPTGVTPWKKGVLVTCAPDIFYAEDTDGDGKADKKEVLFTGFGEGNQQHRVNGLVYGLDGWYYGANGDSGGQIKSLKTGKVVDIRGRDFRIDPERGAIEAQSGQTQYGRCRDDFGNWFGCGNSNPMFHFVLDELNLNRNPHVTYPSPKLNLVNGAVRVYPISKALPRFNYPGAVNHFTSACGLHIYRDELLDVAIRPQSDDKARRGFQGNAFVCEPVHNLIHREVVERDGVTFKARRADDEKEREFLASTDIWFRPVFVQTGPDGALWIADMYRYVIEHPEWIPKDWQKKLDLRAGHDMGRIYRVVPRDQKPGPIVRPAEWTEEQLAKGLTSRNGWVRDTCQQIVVRKGIENHQNFLKLTDATNAPATRTHAMWTMALADPASYRARGEFDGEVRTQMLRIMHRNLRFMEEDAHRIATRLATVKLDAPCRLELAYLLGGNGKWGGLLAETLLRTEGDRYLEAAVWSSIREENWPAFVERLLQDRRWLRRAWTPTLARLAHAFNQTDTTIKLYDALIEPEDGKKPFLTLAPLIEQLDLDKIAGDPKLKATYEKLSRAVASARAAAADPKAPLADRAMAVDLLGRDSRHRTLDCTVLSGFLAAHLPDDLQGAAIARLGQMNDPHVAEVFLKAWPGLGPVQRGRVLDSFLSRPDGISQLLEAFEKKRLLPYDIDAARRQRLLTHKSEEIRQRAAKVFATASDPGRAAVVEKYRREALVRSDVNVERGAKVFARACAACHQLGGVGQPVGPDLRSVGDKSLDGLMVSLFDPNRGVDPRYISYLATTRRGVSLIGVLSAESGTTITLVAADGKQHDLLRNDLEDLTSTGKSLMPEGLEKDLSPMDVADLYVYLRREWSAK